MSHFALLDTNNIVVWVTVGTQQDDGKEQELSARTGEVYRQTSYNTYGGIHYDSETGLPSSDQSKAYRYNFAGLDYIFDPDFGPEGAFIPPKPYSSWTLNEATALWEPPIPQPEKGHIWSEPQQAWIMIEANT